MAPALHTMLPRGDPRELVSPYGKFRVFDLEEEEKIYKKKVGIQSQAMEGHMCYTHEWIAEPAVREDADGMGVERILSDLADWGLPTQRIDPTAPRPKPQKERVLVFADRLGFCDRILEQAPRGRIGESSMVTEDPGSMSKDDIAKYVCAKEWDMIIFATGLDTPASASIYDVMKQQNDVTHQYLCLCKVISENRSCCKRLAVLTRSVFAEKEKLHRKRGLSLITNSLLFGMSNTLRLEFEDLPLQLIDTDWNPDAGAFEQIASDLFLVHTFGQNTLRILNDGERYALRQMHSRHHEIPEAVRFSLPDEGIIGISGGNGSLGLIMGSWILDRVAKASAPKRLAIHFLSRSCKIGDDNQARWKELQKRAKKLGIHVEQRKCDISTPEAAQAYISDVSPNLVGFIHSAGVLQDSMLPNQTWEKYEAVFDPKHRAAMYLHDALERHANPNLAFFWMFSSISAWGNMGQSNYSASNAFLDALARHRRAKGKPGLAIQWGGWGEVGMAANMSEAMRIRMENSQMPMMSNAEAITGLELGLTTGLPVFTVYKLNPKVLVPMVREHDNICAAYQRNLTSEIILPPAPQRWTRDAFYAVHRWWHQQVYPTYEGEVYEQWTCKRLIYSSYTEPALAQQARHYVGATEESYKECYRNPEDMTCDYLPPQDAAYAALLAKIACH